MQSLRVVTGQAVWPALEDIARRRGRAMAAVAVAYLTRDLLELRSGDLLVVNLENGTCRAGQTDPGVVRKMRDRGVRVFRSADLHAKMMVFGDVVVVGSTNFSDSSLHRYREAVSITESKVLARQVRRQIQDLGDVEVSDVDLDAAQAEWRPPKGGGGARDPRRVAGAETPISRKDRLWLVMTSHADAPATVLEAAEHRRHRRSKGFEVEWVWSVGSLVTGLAAKDVVIQIHEEDDGHEQAWPPARVLEIINVPSRGSGGPWTVTYILNPTGVRPVPVASLAGCLSQRGMRLPRAPGRLLTDEAVRGQVLGLWGTRRFDSQ